MAFLDAAVSLYSIILIFSIIYYSCPSHILLLSCIILCFTVYIINMADILCDLVLLPLPYPVICCHLLLLYAFCDITVILYNIFVCHSHIHTSILLLYLVRSCVIAPAILALSCTYSVILPLSSTIFPLSCTILCCCHYLVKSCVVAIILYNLCVVVIILCNLVLLSLSCAILCCCHYLVQSCVVAIILCNFVLLSLSCVVAIILCNLVLLPLSCAILCCCRYPVQYCVVTLSHILYCCQDTFSGSKTYVHLVVPLHFTKYCYWLVCRLQLVVIKKCQFCRCSTVVQRHCHIYKTLLKCLKACHTS